MMTMTMMMLRRTVMRTMTMMLVVMMMLRMVDDDEEDARRRYMRQLSSSLFENSSWTSFGQSWGSPGLLFGACVDTVTCYTSAVWRRTKMAV